MMALTRGSSAWRARFWGSPCNTAEMATVYLPSAGRLYVNKRAYQAFRMLDWLFRKHCYQVRPGVSGTYNCRKITGGNTPSSHSWATAWDVNWDTNPYRLDKLVTDMPRAMIEEIEAVRTAAGIPVWRWGGDWDGRPETPHGNYDAMHFEIVASPAELAAGIRFPAFDLSLPARAPLLARGDRGGAVVMLQTEMGLTPADGIFGAQTEEAVRAYQESRGLTVDALVGPAVWTALHTNQPPRRAGQPSPTKQ